MHKSLLLHTEIQQDQLKKNTQEQKNKTNLNTVTQEEMKKINLSFLVPVMLEGQSTKPARYFRKGVKTLK